MRWGAYSSYLDALASSIDSVLLPGVGSVGLGDTYIPLRLTRWSEEQALRSFASGGDHTTLSISEALAEQPRLVLTGPKGTGKSALLRRHALELASTARASGVRSSLHSGGVSRLPLYIPLADVSADADLHQEMRSSLERLGLDDSGDFLEAHLEHGDAAVFFDDLDSFEPEALREVAQKIIELVRRYPGIRVVAATRDIADAAIFDGFVTYEVAGVDPARVESLASRWGYSDVADSSGFLQVIERLPLIRSLVARPGWLAAGLANLGREHIRAYDIVAGFVDYIESDPDPEWFTLARRMHEAHAAIGSRDQLTVHPGRSGLLSWLTDDTFTFVHPAVQVYLAAAADSADDVDAAIEMASRADDPWWRMAVVLASAHFEAEPAAAMIRRLLDGSHAQIAALALSEHLDPDPGLVEAAQIALLTKIGLESDEPTRRRHAIALAAVRRGEPVRKTGIVGPVLDALQNGTAAVRAAAATALGGLHDPAAIAPLLSTLGDDDRDARDRAADALAVFGDRTVQPLVRQLNVPDSEIRLAARRALSQQGEIAVPALIALLDSASSTTRVEVAGALAGIGSPAVPALIAAIARGGSGGTMSATDEGLAAIEAASDALTQIGSPAVAALVAFYGEADPSHRELVVDVLRAIGADAVETLSIMATDPHHAHSVDAAGLLGSLPDIGREAARALVRALADERFEVRWAARRSLKRLEDDAEDALLDALDSDDERVRWEATEILLQYPDPPIDRLRPVLKTRLDSDSVQDRRQAVRALAEMSGPLIRDLLEQAIDDEDPIVRRAAVAHLGTDEDPSAVELLAARWSQETDIDTAQSILEAIAASNPEGAIPTLIDALASNDTRVCSTATELLSHIGPPAVIPLVEALNSRPAEIDLDRSLSILARAGVAARAEGRTPANLARAYHRMMVEPLDVDELVYLATTIEWWPPAHELHRTFTAAKQFLECRSLGGIAAAVGTLEWIDGTETWLRPAAQKALRQLRLISQAVQYYNRGGTRSAKEKGLLTATARLSEMQAMIGTLGEPHQRIFHAVAEHWGGLINHAIRELQGRAELDVELRTEHIRIRDENTTAVLVFELVNQGEGLASNTQLTLEADSESLELQSAQTHYLPPLGHGDRMTAEFTVRRKGPGVAPVNIIVTYDDPQTEGLSRKFAREIRFFVEEAAYREIGKSPYIAGPPVKSREMFYGRQPTFTWVQENLSGTYQDNVLVLYGERRTGKTSVLYQLQYHLPETYAFVLIDLQTIAYALGSTADLLYAMTRKTVSGLRKQGFNLELPNREDFAKHPIERFERLGEEIGNQASEVGRRAVLIVDEFDLLIEAVEKDQVSPYVFDCIRGLMQHQDGLSFIFTGANKVSEMLRNPQSILFNTALRRKVSFLEREDAERLIREPVGDVLWYDDLAFEKILRATAGHPYFIQYICHEIVNIARREEKNFVTLRDVDRALQTTVQETTGIIRHAYMSLNMEARIVLAAMSRITDDGRPFVGLDDVLETLLQDDITVSKRDAIETVRHLVDRDFISERGQDGASRQFGFTMDIVRVWLEQNDEYARLLEEQRHE